jgi:pentapeptide MXKDX repeat protein
MKTKTLKKHKNRRSRTTKRNIGGNTIDKLAMITFIRNIAVQILNSIEDPKPDSTLSTKFITMSKSRHIHYKPMVTFMNDNNIISNNFDEFKQKASVMINERNKMIHPADLNIKARTCIELCNIYNLQDFLSFELGILKFFARDRPNTRSMTEFIDPDRPVGFEHQKRRGSTSSKGVIGKDTIGKDTIGKDTIGKDAIGKDTIGKDAIGKDTIGKEIAYNKNTSKK